MDLSHSGTEPLTFHKDYQTLPLNILVLAIGLVQNNGQPSDENIFFYQTTWKDLTWDLVFVYALKRGHQGDVAMETDKVPPVIWDNKKQKFITKKRHGISTYINISQSDLFERKKSQ